MTDPTPAEAIQAQAARKYEAIRSNTDLCQNAKVKLLAQAHTEAATKLADFQSLYSAAALVRRNLLSTRLLGNNTMSRHRPTPQQCFDPTNDRSGLAVVGQSG